MSEWKGVHGAADGTGWALGREFLDLTTLADDIRVVPVGLPAGLHFYWGHPSLSYTGEVVPGINSMAGCAHGVIFNHVSQLETYLRSPGLHYVLYVERFHGPQRLYLRSWLVPPGSDAFSRSFCDPAHPRDLIDRSPPHSTLTKRLIESDRLRANICDSCGSVAGPYWCHGCGRG